MAKQKVRILFTNTTNTSGETITQGADVAWLEAVQGFAKMDVVINVKTLSGTSPTITVSVQEVIDGTVYLETAKSGALSATGVYALANEVSPNTNVTKSIGPFPMCGKGANKRIVTTIGGTTSAVSADIYFIFFED